MRLLKCSDDGILSLTAQFMNEDGIPLYAILSHTWEDGQEVTYDDFVHGTGKHKTGYEKIRFCAKQAKDHGLDYFWVDTCCIDKSSSAELAESINSMFRWYERAACCFVYLVDVSRGSSDSSSGESTRPWKPAFRKSRWFTRGWTLQELLAPSRLEFFSKEGELLGDKVSLQQTLHEITSIPLDALRKTRSLASFDEDTRFSWASTRQTTRGEDRAYCLLGIFDIHIPLIYSEGERKAMYRLRRELNQASNPQKDTISKLVTSLSAPDPSSNYSAAVEQRQDNTGLWFLDSNVFEGWKKNGASFLWLYGIPGCGKTILSSTIIEDLLHLCDINTSSAIAYFYFDFNDSQKQVPEMMLRSLISQLLPRVLQLPNFLLKRCDTENPAQRPYTRKSLEYTMQQIIKEIPSVYVVLDALDECCDRRKLMDVIENIASWQLQNLHMIFTSRRVREIESSLETILEEEKMICLEKDIVDGDIRNYVQHELSNDRLLSKWDKDKDLRREIEETLVKGAYGMFRWAVCQLNTIGQCRSKADVRKALVTLPETLDGTYDRMLSAISENDSQLAKRLLQWLTFSYEPISLGELAVAVAIDTENEPYFDHERIIEDPLDVLSICSSLITIYEVYPPSINPSKVKFARLAHYSVKEYLLSDRIYTGSAACYGMENSSCHSAIAQSCIRYFLQFQDEDVKTYHSIEGLKLKKYAAKYWPCHLKCSGEEREHCSRTAIALLQDRSAWHRMVSENSDGIHAGMLSENYSPIYTPMIYASGKGLSSIVKLLLEDSGNIDDQCAWGSACLHALGDATKNRHEHVVRLLIDWGVDINAASDYHGTGTLHIAVRMHNLSMIELLTAEGADVNAEWGTHETALYIATESDNLDVFKLLIDRGADVESKTPEGLSILHHASFKGNVEAVEVLLEQGADVNLQALDGDVPIFGAVLKMHIDVVKLLLASGANINARGGVHHYTPLQVAAGGIDQWGSEHRSQKMVQLLIDNGADVNAEGGLYHTALQVAAVFGNYGIALVLLRAGANPRKRGGYYYSAVQAARKRGHVGLANLLRRYEAKLVTEGNTIVIEPDF